MPTPPVSNQWHPTVVMLLALLVFEVAAFAALRYVFAKL